MRQYLTTLTMAEGDRHRASGSWRNETLRDLVEFRARDSPDGLALVDRHLRLDNAEALRAVDGVAALLGDAGAMSGSPVIVQLRNRAAHAVTNVAISSIGAVIVPVKRSLRETELAAIAARVGARHVVAEADMQSVAAVNDLRVISDAEVELATSSRLGPVQDRTGGHADAVLDLMFTSGTTGVPKGILNTTNTKLSALRSLVLELALGPDDPWLVVPPMAHNAGWLYSYLPALVSGAPAVFQERFDAEATLRMVEEHAIASVFLTPTHASDVLAARRAGGDAPSTLRFVLIGGASTSPALVAELRDSLGAEVISIYGCTENQGVSFVRPGTPPAEADGTVGTACPGNEVAIFGADRTRQMPGGEVGEIATRGAGTFVGYFDDQEATDACFNDHGWFFGGDLGYLDPRGALCVVGRTKELIIRGGLNITPEDVEAAIADHSAVERVAAVGLPDERLGERVCAVVVARGALRLESVVSHLAAKQVGTHLWPEALLIVDQFPLTDIGKVQRRLLRDQVIAAAEGDELEVRG